MSIVQKTSNYYLRDEDYTNVYGGTEMPLPFYDDGVILPVSPTDPVKTAIPLHQQTLHSRVFCG